MTIRKLAILLLSSSILLSINNLNFDYISSLSNSDYILVDLESHNKTSYLFDKNHPYLMSDFEYMNFKIDGSMMYPLSNIIPQRILFNVQDTLSMSQLSILQDHSSKFYDTSVALKTYLKENINSIVQVESKSINGNNYNKKFIASIYKNTGRLNLDVGYMFSDETILTYTDNSYFNRGLESFNTKFYLDYTTTSDLIINNRFNSQIANYKRSNIDYLSENIWNRLIIKKYLGNSELKFESNYKHIDSDLLLDSLSLDNDYHQLSLQIKKYLENSDFVIGINQFNKSKGLYYFLYRYNFSNFLLEASLDNSIFLNIYNDTNQSSDIYIDRISSKNYKVKFIYGAENFYQGITLGKEIKDSSTEIDNYYYYLYDGSIDYDWLKLNFNYGKYQSGKLYIQSFLGLDVIISPELKDKRYRPFCRAKVNSLGINSNYSISNQELDVISANNSQISSILVVDGEIGLLFNQFSISFIKENMLRKYMYYSNNNIINNISNYLIKINWIFKD